MPRTPFDDLDDSHVLTPKDIAARLHVDPRLCVARSAAATPPKRRESSVVPQRRTPATC
jgi:hypothetical protein